MLEVSELEGEVEEEREKRRDEEGALTLVHQLGGTEASEGGLLGL